MNITELWEYIVIQKSLFPDKFFGVIGRDNRFYSVELKNGGVWIHYPSWASTINSIHDLSILKYPVRLHLEELPPYECIMGLYEASEPTDLRLGQWFCNKYTKVIATELYEEKNKKKAYEMIYSQFYGIT